MKAIILSENGGADKLILKEIDKPVIKPNKVLMQLHEKVSHRIEKARW